MKPVLKTAFWTACAVLFFSSVFAGARTPAIKPVSEILVEFKKEITARDLSLFAAKHKAEPASLERAKALLENIYGLGKTRLYLENVPFSCYKIDDPSKIEEIINALKNESLVINAQPNFPRYALYTPLAAPDDTIYKKAYITFPSADQWGFNIINADAAYNAGLISQLPARQVIVAVLDTGMKTDHPDLAGMTITGRNILNPGAQAYDDELLGGHGTHTAGIIGAQTGNGAGIAGTAYTNTSWTARVLLMPVKILDLNGDGTDADAAAGIIWAADNSADVLNISMGGPDNSKALQDAINYAYQKGCVIVGAAGNINAPAWYPAACANVISVAATNDSDNRASFSNYGKIDVSAPGVDIWSCTNWDTFSTTLPAYYMDDGTSFAAPFVAGLAALIILQDSGLTPDDVRSIIERSAVDIESIGYDIYSGWGRIDVLRALNRVYNTQVNTNTYNWPNPFSPGRDLFTSIVFVLASPGDVSISIYDAAGDLVWKKDLASAQLTAGNNTVKWDGRNLSGKTTANGTYFYVIKTQQGTKRNKIAVVQ